MFIKKIYILIICISAGITFLSYNCLYSQTKKTGISVEDAKLIKEYKEEIVKFQISNNYNKASQYISKVAYIYWNSNNFSEAIKFFKDALACYEKTGNENAKKVIYNNLGMIYSDTEDYENSLEFFSKGLELSKKTSDEREIALGYNNVAIAYSYKNEYEIAIDYAKRALDIAAELNDTHLMLSCYIMLTEYFEKQGNTEKSLEYFNYYSSLQKHIQDVENKEKMEALNARTKQAEREKLIKEKELLITTASLEEAQQINIERKLQNDLLNKEIEINELALKEQKAKQQIQRLIIFAGSGTLFLVLVLIVVIYRNYKRQRTNNELLNEKNKILESQKEKINEQRKELEHINKKLAKKNNQILDSISYASRIQEAILPYQNNIKKYLPESFILYKPRDIVSGDFYWFAEQDNKLFIGEIDCTGHGVPGAFMSMIGNTLLNEIVNDRKIFDPAQILKQLNKGIIYTLNQGNAGDHFQDDGMEVTLCTYDREKKEIEIASANQTAYLIKDGQLHKVVGDIYTVGGTFSLSDENNFTKHKFKVDEKTTLFMQSDGYNDQFGGIKNRKFLASQFEDMLLENHNLPMAQQVEILDLTFKSWMGKNKQIDDVLVIGLNFKSA